MAEFKLPELGENVTGGDVVGILVAVGDTIAPDQDVLELETDKATVTVPSATGGVVQAIHIAEGDHVEVGQVVLSLGDSGQSVSAPKTEPATETATTTTAETKPPASSTPPAASGPVEFVLPELGENITGGDVVSMLVSVGDTVSQGQDVLELETDKATVTVPSSVDGTITSINIKEGDRVEIGQVVFVTASGSSASTPAPAESATVSETVAPSPDSTATTTDDTLAPARSPGFQVDDARSTVPAAPNVRRLARELGLDVTQVPPGESGRVTIPDLKAHSRTINQGTASAQTPTAVSTSVATTKPLPDFSQWGEIEVEKMSSIRRATSNQMVYAWSTAPRVTQFDKAHIDELEGMRKKYGQRLQKTGAKLTVTAILLKVVATALKLFPKFNASVDMEHDQVILKKYYHIGVAVDTERGLVVPVIRDVDRKNIFELAQELNEVATKARDRKLGLEDMQGATFTISNLGGIGGTNFTPIVNAPEVAILGVARGSVEPVYNGEAFVPHLMMPLALSYDHRLIDGAEGARFLRWICTALEDPMTLSLQAW